MSDSGAVSGTIARKLRKKTKSGPKGRKLKITFLLMSKARPTTKSGKPIGKTWHEDWPEFLEQLKVLARRYKLTIRKMAG